MTTRDRGPRRAIRPMTLRPERLERRLLLSVSSQALLSSEVNMYWNYTDGLYGQYPGLAGINSTSTSTSTFTINGVTETITDTTTDTYSSTTSGSSGNMTTTWSGQDTSYSTTTTTGTQTQPDNLGYTHTYNSTYVSKEVVIGSGTNGPNSSSISWSNHDWTNELVDDVATKGTETVHSHTHNYMDWYWSGGGTYNDYNSQQSAMTPSQETLQTFSVNDGGGSANMSVDSPPPSGGYNYFTDNIPSGGGTYLNESTINRFSLGATSNRASGGAASTFSLATDGAENLALITTVTRARADNTGNGGGGGGGSMGGGGGSGTIIGSDSSYLNDYATDTFNYGASGGYSPSSGNYGTFSLNSNGTDAATRQIYGSGSTSVVSDYYNITDQHVSSFVSTDAGSFGSSGSDTITDNTLSIDTITATATGLTSRPGQGDGIGTDSYNFNETIHLYKGYTDANHPVYDTLTSGYTPSGTFASGTLHDFGDDTTQIRMNGSGSGTMVYIPPNSSSSQGYLVSDSYTEAETRTRAYALNVNSNGSMDTTDTTNDTTNGSGSLSNTSVGVNASDGNTITASVSAAGVNSFNWANSDSVNGGSSAGVPGAPNYVTRDNPNNLAIHTGDNVQWIGGQWSGIGGDLTGVLDGTGSLSGMGIEAKGASDPIVTAILPGDAVPQSDSLEVETTLRALQSLQQFVEEYGRTTTLLWYDSYGGGGSYNTMDAVSELANTRASSSDLSSQAQSFFQNTKNAIAGGRVDTIGGDNTSYAKGVVNTTGMPALNGVYASKTHVYYTPGFYRSDFFVSRTLGQSGPKVWEDPFAE